MTLRERGKEICDELWYNGIPAEYIITPNHKLILILHDRVILGHVKDVKDPETGDILHYWDKIKLDQRHLFRENKIRFRPSIFNFEI